MMYWIKKLFSDPKGHAAALAEVIVTAIFSLFPIIIPYFVEAAKKQDGSFGSFDQFVGRGQVYLLSYGIFGTIFWLGMVKGDRPRHGARIFLGTLGTIAIFPVAGFLGVDPTFSTVLNSNLIVLSYWFYGLFLLLNYLLLFYVNITPPSAGDVLSRETGTMRDKWQEFNSHG